jgi:uncharacterized protein GlcG (DUF336 family)
VSVAICLIDIHGNVVLKHRMSEAPVFSIDLSERKAYTSALVGMRTADLLPLVQPGQPLFPLMSQDKYCAMGGGAPLTSEGRVIAGVGVSGGTVEQDVAIPRGGTSRSLTGASVSRNVTSNSRVNPPDATNGKHP